MIEGLKRNTSLHADTDEDEWTADTKRVPAGISCKQVRGKLLGKSERWEFQMILSEHFRQAKVQYLLYS